MRRLQQDGKTTLMVTHDLATAFATSQRFSLIHESRLAFEGSEAELKASELYNVKEFLKPTDQSLFV